MRRLGKDAAANGAGAEEDRRPLRSDRVDAEPSLSKLTFPPALNSSPETAAVRAKAANDSVDFHIRLNFPSTVSSGSSAEGFELGDNHPNPFNPTTVIPFALPEAGHAVLQVFDVNGRLIRTLIDDFLPAGSGQAVFDAVDDKGEAVPSGIYYYRLLSGKHQKTKRLLLLK